MINCLKEFYSDSHSSRPLSIIRIKVKNDFTKFKLNSNLSFNSFIPRKRVTSFRGPPSRQCAWATQLLSSKCCKNRKSLTTLCLINLLKIQTLKLPLQRRTRYRSTNWPVIINICKSLHDSLKTVFQIFTTSHILQESTFSKCFNLFR